MERSQQNHYQKYGKKWYEANKEKELLRNKQYYEEKGREQKKLAYPEKRKAILKYRYGISLEEFDTLLREQNELCAICSLPYHLTIHVDHNHKTGKVRGLLCNNCNRGIGHLKEDITILERAIEYLKRDISGHGGSCGV